MHPALASVALRAIRGGSLINQSLLHDRTVYREAVRRRLGSVIGGGSGDKGFQDGILASLDTVRFLNW